MAEETRLARGGGKLAARNEEPIQDAGSLIRGTIEELERMLDAKQVVSDPLTFGNATIVPLVSMGFGFGAGAGGGTGTSAKGEAGEGGGGGGAGGGGVKPIAVLVIQDGVVRLEPIPEPPSGLDKLGGALAAALDRRSGKSSDAG